MGAALNYVWPTWELFLTFQNWLEKASFVKHFLRIHPKGLSPSKTNLHFFPCTFVISMFYPSFEAFCSENLVWKVHTGLHLAASRIDWTSSQGICHKGSQPLMVPAIILTFLLSACYKGFHFLRLFWRLHSLHPLVVTCLVSYWLEGLLGYYYSIARWWSL